jgi:hypothetical protein
LLLLTIGLVIVGAIALVFGFVSGDQLPIFISIACSLLAGGVLVLFSRMSRRAPAVSTAGGSSMVADDAVAAAVSGSDVTETVPLATAVDDAEFPIADYETLTVAQVLPQLETLDLDQLDLVAEREEQGKARASVLKRIDQLADALEGVTPEAAASEVAETDEPATSAAGAVSGTVADDGFPIAGYDELTVAAILPMLDGLSDDELDEVAEREETGPNRATILDRIDAIFDDRDAEEGAAPVKAAAAKKAPVKSAAKKAPAKKAPVKSAVKKTAAKKTAAKKTAAKKSAVKRAPAKAAAKKASSAVKSPAKKAPAKKAAVKKAAVKKAPAKKTAAKKAPAKKTAKRR